MNNYELMVILKPSLPENVRKGVQDRIETILTKNNSEIVDIDVWGKKYLAYPVKKHLEGYYILFQLKTDNSSVKLISQSVKLISDVLRLGLFRVEDFTKKEIKKETDAAISLPDIEEEPAVVDDVYLNKI